MSTGLFLENGSLFKNLSQPGVLVTPEEISTPNAAAVKETVVPMFSRAMTISLCRFSKWTLKFVDIFADL